MPTKALLRCVKVSALLKRADEFGLGAGAVAFEWAKVLARKEWIVRYTGAATAEQQYQQEGIALFKRVAFFEDPHRVRVDGQVLRGDKIMIATGSKPAMPRIQGIDAEQPITNVEAVSLRQLPASVIIIGGGPGGCEFAQLFSTFGVQVTVLEMANTILPHEEPELRQIIRQTLERNGAAIVTGVEVTQLGQDGGRKPVQARAQGRTRELVAEEILMAVGRAPQTPELRLDAVGVETNGQGRVTINEYVQTTSRTFTPLALCQGRGSLHMWRMIRARWRG